MNKINKTIDEMVHLIEFVEEKPLIQKTVLISGFEPWDLLRLEKDAFYDVIDEKLSEANGNIYIEVKEAELAFVYDKNTDEVAIKATAIDYTIDEE